MPCVFARVTRCCARGAKHICIGAVGINKVLFVVVGVDVMFSAVVYISLPNFYKESQWCL